LRLSCFLKAGSKSIFGLVGLLQLCCSTLCQGLGLCCTSLCSIPVLECYSHFTTNLMFLHVGLMCTSWKFLS
jgi:hypothetical protein